MKVPTLHDAMELVDRVAQEGTNVVVFWNFDTTSLCHKVQQFEHRTRGSGPPVSVINPIIIFTSFFGNCEMLASLALIFPHQAIS